MKILLILFFSFFLSSSLLGENYSSEEIYNAYGNSNCILQDKIGYIWCGTNEGISRYDGFIFTAYYTGDPVTAIAEDDKGNIWGGTINGELIKYVRGTGAIEKHQTTPDPLFYYYSREYQNLPSNYSYYKRSTITSILIEKNILYAGTWGSGVYLFNSLTDKQELHLYNLQDERSLPGNYITSIIYSTEDSMLICGSFDAGLIRINNSKKEYWQTLGNSQFTSLSAFEKDIYAGTQQGLLNVKPGYDEFEVIFVEPVTHLFHKDKLLAATIAGGIKVVDLEEHIIKNIAKDSLGQENVSLNCLIIDKNNIIWGSLSGGFGLIKWKETSSLFTNYKLRGVTSLAENSVGDIYIGTLKNGLYKFSLQNKTLSQIRKDLTGIKELSYAPGRKLYIAAADELLYLDERTNLYSTILKGNNFSTIVIDNDGALWVGTSGEGIIKFAVDGSVKKNIHYRKSNIYPGTIPDNYIEKLFISLGNLWGFTREGYLLHYSQDKDEFLNWKVKDNKLNILTSFPTNEYIYIGTYGEGVFRFNKSTHNTDSIGSELLSGFRNIFSITQDQSGSIWMTTESGLLQFNESAHHLFYYSQRDGIDEKHFNSAVMKSHDEKRLIFGGMNGFVTLLPDERERKSEPPQLTITSLKILNSEWIINTLPLNLNSNENSLTFQFACLDYNDPQKNQYKWMLEGYDKNYHYSYGESRIAEYSDLPPGEYLFRMSGANAFGVWSNQKISIPVIIASPFYSTWWFIVLTILFLIALPGYFLYIRIRHLIAIREIKSRLSADLHDDIGSGLTEISLVSELIRKDIPLVDESQAKQLQFISTRAREIVNNMSDIVWLVSPKESSQTDLLMRLKNKTLPVTESLGIVLNVQIDSDIEDEKLSMDRKQNIYLILKEGVNNAIKHSECRNILVEYNTDNKKYIVKISDDGKGFDPSEAAGNGLRNMRKRAADIKAEIEIITSFGENKPNGTTILLSGKL